MNWDLATLMKQALDKNKQELNKVVKSAVIIKGNPKFIKLYKDESKNFYDNISEFLELRGYKVEYDSGEEYTTPPIADLWIGHSRGISRLRFAPEEVKTIGLGGKSLKSDNFKIINHPIDDEMINEWYKENSSTKGMTPPKEHFIFTDEMKEAIDELIAA